MSSIIIRGKFSGGFDLITFSPNAIWFNRFSLKAGLYDLGAKCAKKIACRSYFVTTEIIRGRPRGALPLHAIDALALLVDP
jgi:hypothetical protein